MSVTFVSVPEGTNPPWQVAFGLDWAPLAGSHSEKKEHRNLVAAHSAAYEVRLANERTIIYGFLEEGDAQEDMPKAALSRMLSASVLLATFPNVAPNAVWIEVDGSTARMAVLREGIPQPSGDFTGPLSEAVERIDQIERDSQMSFSFYGNYHAVYASSIPITLAELVEEGDRAAAALKRPAKGTSAGQVAVLGLLVLACAYVFWPASAPKQQKTKQVEDPNVVYQRTLPAKLAAVGAPVAIAAPVLTTGWNLEVLQAGWSLSEISCSVAECRYTWVIAGGNFKSLIKALGPHEYQFALDGKSASYSVPNPPIQQAGFDQSRLPTFRSFQERFGTLAQDVGLLKTTLTMGLPSVFGAEANLSVAALRDPVKSGQVSGNGPAALVREILAKLPDDIVIDQLSIKPNGIDPQFVFQGTYYVKN